MKIDFIICRILLGLVFFVFGLNKFLNFIPAQMPPGVAGQFSVILFSTHYLWIIGAVEVIGGALLLAGRYVPLGLLFLAPVIVNILAFDVLMMPKALGMGLVVLLLWLVTAWSVRSAFWPVVEARVTAEK